MAIEPFEITTVYPDGTSETRMSTPEEMEQREEDLAQFEADRIAREQAETEHAAKRASAREKLAKLGLTEEEVAAAFGL